MMVAQLLQDQESKVYSKQEKSVVNWAIKVLWGNDDSIEDFSTQKSFSEFLLPNIRRNLASNIIHKVHVIGIQTRFAYSPFGTRWIRSKKNYNFRACCKQLAV